MARRLKIFGQDIIIGKRLYGVGRDEQSFGWVNEYGKVEDIRNLDTYKGLVYACINLISESVGDYEPIIYKRDAKKKWVDIGDHPLLQLLDHPGGLDEKAMPITKTKLFYATAAFIELQGSCYWYIPKGTITGKPKEIVLLRSDRVGKKINDRTGDIDYYFIRINGGNNIRLEIDEVLPFSGFDPKDPYGSIGTVEASKDYIATDQYTTDFTKNFFKNNAGVSGILSLKGDVAKTAFQKITRAWREKYEGTGNAGKTMIVRESDASFTKLGLGLDELDMSALQKMSRDDIAMMFRVPLPLLGKAEESGLGRANVETLEYIFAKYNINKKLKVIDDILLIALERYYKAEPGQYKIGHTNIIPEDKEYILRERELGVDKWITRNEVRLEDGLEAKEGGDELYVPISSIPLGEDYSDPTADTDKAIKVKILKKFPVEGKKKDSSPINSTNKENFRLRLMSNQVKYERKYISPFKKILREQKKEALENLEAHASSLNKAFDQKLFDDSKADEIMKRMLGPILIRLGKEQGSLAMVFAGDNEDNFEMTLNYERLVANSTGKMASNFNDETIDRLNKTLSEGIQEGDSLGDLKKRVGEVYDFASNYRAERVARTETLKASNAASEEAYRQTGYVVSKEWYTNPGACPECEVFNGKEVGLGDSFIQQGQSYTYTDENGDEKSKVNSYEDVDTPPLHPNCRCAILPVR